MTIRYWLLGALLASAPAIALDLKGVELGKAAAPEQLTEVLGVDFERTHCPMYKRSAHDAGAATYRCDGAALIEGVHCSLEITFGAGDVVEEIDVTFFTQYFDAIAAGAARKWGKPKADMHATLQNRFGAAYQEQIQGWVEPSGANAFLYRMDPADVRSGMLILKSHGEPALDPTKSRM